MQKQRSQTDTFLCRLNSLSSDIEQSAVAYINCNHISLAPVAKMKILFVLFAAYLIIDLAGSSCVLNLRIEYKLVLQFLIEWNFDFRSTSHCKLVSKLLYLHDTSYIVSLNMVYILIVCKLT